MADIRAAIEAGTFLAFRESFYAARGRWPAAVTRRPLPNGPRTNARGRGILQG